MTLKSYCDEQNWYLISKLTQNNRKNNVGTKKFAIFEQHEFLSNRSLFTSQNLFITILTT